MIHHQISVVFHLGVYLLLWAGVLFPQAPSWKSAGGPSGAFVQSYTIAPNGDILAGTREDGVYRSINGGTTWSRAGTGIRYNNIFSLLTTRSGVILAGAVTYNTSSLGGTIYRSTDNGFTWISSPDIQSDDAVYSIIESSNGTLFAGTAELSSPRGVYRSTDGGIHWEQTNTGITNKAIIAMLAAPGDTLFAGVGGALYRSVNNGAQWTALTNGLPSSTTFWSFAVDSTRAVLVGTTDGVYRSTNRGASWNLSNTGLGTSFVRSFHVLPSGTITAATYGGGNFRSTNNGTSWDPANTGLADLNMQAFITIPGSVVLCGGPSGNFLSSDAGITWTKQNNGFSSVLVNTLLRHSGGTLIAGTSPSLYRSKDGGSTWNTVAGIQYVSSLIEAPSGMIFAGTTNGNVYRSADTGTSWTAANTGWPAVGVFDLAVNASGHIFATNSVLFRTTDNGASWTSSNLPTYTYLTAVEVAKNGTVFLGTNSIGIYRSSDNGTSWTSASGDLPVTSVGGIFIDPQNTVFAFGSGAVYRSTNAGINWTTLSAGLPKSAVTSMVIDSSGHFIVGTRDSGVYYSKNHGRTWKNLRSGTSTLSVFSTALEPKNFILIGTKNSVLRSVQPTSFVTVLKDTTLFGTVKAHATAIDSVEVENKGTEPLLIDSVWTNDPNFFAGPHPVMISVGERKWFRTGFSPRRFGNIEGNVFISSNAHSSPDELFIRGTGKAAGFHTPNYVVAFGKRLFTTITDTNIVIVNIGNDTLKIDSAVTSSTLFSVISFPRILAPDDSSFISLKYSPKQIGMHLSDLYIYSNSFNSVDTIRFSATAVGIPKISLSPRQLQFGTALIKSFKDTTVLLTNSGSDTAFFGVAVFSRSEWKLRTPQVPIPPGAQRRDTIRFTPILIGTLTGFTLYTSSSYKIWDTLFLKARGDSILTFIDDIVPAEYAVSQNFPNPFNATTHFEISLPVPSDVTVDIFNAIGQKIDTPVSETLPAGIHRVAWNPVLFSGGIYFYQVRSGKFHSVKKMLLLK